MEEKIYDIAIIGGGINGCGIARDAAGRGLSVYLCDQADIGSATSASSSKLIHGGLRYLEQYAFGLVKKALAERNVLLNMAPHIVWPMQFVLPHDSYLRPKWLIRLGLFFYDSLSALGALSKSFSVSFAKHISGDPLKEKYDVGFVYSDCWVDDHRLVIFNALDAQRKGAVISPFNKCTKAVVKDGLWHVETEHGLVKARSLVNAAGPWAERLIQESIPHEKTRKLKLVKGSHIVVKRMFDHEFNYIFQQLDGRIVFAMPYEKDYTLIGTTDEPYEGNPADAVCTEEAMQYLCDAVNPYFKKEISINDVVWSYAGVRPLIDDRPSGDSAKSQKASRDYRVSLRRTQGVPLVNVWGGKITTYRVLAEDVLGKLKEYLAVSGKWTENSVLLGGDIGDQTSFEHKLKREYPWLPKNIIQRWVRSYGDMAYVILDGKKSLEDMGDKISEDLYEAEIVYLVNHEWLRGVDALLWRRTKLGLRLSASEVERATVCLARIVD